MKIPLILPGVIALVLMLSLPLPASAMDEPEFMIKRMVISENIADKEPVGVGSTFSAAIEKVYCFLEAGSIENDTTVTFVWYHEKEEMARISLPLAKGKRWRTYSSKRIGGLKGSWQVELQESSGIILNSVSFQIE